MTRFRNSWPSMSATRPLQTQKVPLLAIVDEHCMMRALREWVHIDRYAVQSGAGFVGSTDEVTVEARWKLPIRILKAQVSCLGVLLSPLFTMEESIPAEVEREEYPLWHFIQSFQAASNDADQTPSIESQRSLSFGTKSYCSEQGATVCRSQLCQNVEQMIRNENVQDAWQLVPLLDGKTVRCRVPFACPSFLFCRSWRP